MKNIRLTRYVRNTCSAVALLLAFSSRGGSLAEDRLAWYKFNETSGTVATNSAGPAGNGTLYNGPVWSSGSLLFDGANDYVQTPVTNGTSRTLAAWIYPQSSDPVGGSLESVFDCDVSGNYGTGWGLNNHFIYVILDDLVWNSGVMIALNQWQHVCVTFDSTTVRVYLNGELKGSRTYTQGPVTTSVTYKIGRSEPNSLYFHGNIKDAKIYSRIVTDLEVHTIQSSEAPAPDTAPTALSAVGSAGCVSLSWTAPNDGETWYTVSRSTTAGGPYTAVSNTVVGTRFSDTNVVNGTTYHYVVAATNIAGIGPNSTEISATPAAGTTYYVDPAGNDANNGTSTNTPWKSFAKVNGTPFKGGDQILFKSGGSWTGTLSPGGSGTIAAQITLGSYGTGAKPYIDSLGAGAGIAISGQSYFTIQGFEVTSSLLADGNRCGIRVGGGGDGSTIRSIRILNNHVHDIQATRNVNQSARNWGGIFVWIDEPGRADDVLIEGNTVVNAHGQGISFWGEFDNVYTDHTSMNYNNCSTRVVVRGNRVWRTSGDGILLLGTDNELAEFNEVAYAGILSDTGNAIAAAWPSRHRDGVWQYNHVHHTKWLEANDSTAFDNDGYVYGTTYFQYNYTHDNEGGFNMEYYWTWDYGQTVSRYNLSVNDGRGTWARVYFSNRPGSELYNNVFYNPGMTLDVSNGGAGYHTFRNNIFIGADRSASFATQGVYYNNSFNGGVTRPTSANENKTEDPLFVAPNTTGNLPGFILQSGSPCRSAGQVVSNNGGLDFWSTAVPTSPTAPHRGMSQINLGSDYTATARYAHIAGPYTLVLPASGSIITNFSVTVHDQNFRPMTSPSVSWSVEPAVSGYSISSGGQLTLSAGAQPQRVAIVAQSGSATNTFSITVLPATASSSWINTAGGNWLTAANWQGGVIANGTDQTATFALSTGVTVNQDSLSQTIGHLAFSTADHTIQGNTLTLDVSSGASTVSVDGSATAMISATVAGSDGLVKTGTGTLRLTAASSISGTTTVGGGTLAYQNTYSSSSNVISGGAVLELNTAAGGWDGGTTTFSGTGTLRKSGPGNIVWGASTATFALGSGALIDVQDGTFVGGSNANEKWDTNKADLNVASGAFFSTVEANVRVNKITGTGTITTGYSGAGYENLTIGVDNGNSTFDGAIQDLSARGKLIKSGTGTITFAGSNSYSGETDIQAGMLVASNSAALGAGGHYGETMSWIRDGATLALQGGVSINEHFHVWGSGVGGLGAVRSLSGNNSLTDSYCLRSDVVVGVDADTLTVASFYQQGGPFGLTKKGGGTLIVSAFSYTGNTAVESGTLRLDAPSLADGATVSIASGATLDLNFSGSDTVSTLFIGGVQQVRGTWNAARDAVHFSGSGSLVVTSGPEPISDGSWTATADGNWSDLANWLNTVMANGADHTATFGQSVDLAVWTDAGRVIANLVFSNANTRLVGGPLALNSSGGTSTIYVAESRTAFVSAALTGAVSVVKTGTGALVLGGANAWSGATIVSAGLLRVPADTSAGEAVPNNGFETPVFGDKDWAYNPGGATWSFASAGIGRNGSPWVSTAPEGAQAGFIQNSGSLSQTFAVAVGGFYDLTFKAANRPGYSDSGIAVQVDGATLKSWPAGTFALGGTFKSFTVTNIFLEAGNRTLTFVGSQNGADSATAIDDVRLTGYASATLPPATALSVAAGAALLLEKAQTVASLSGDAGAQVTNCVALTVGDATDTVFAGTIAGAGSLAMTGSGTLTLSGANTYTGTTAVDGGKLLLGPSGSLASTNLTVASGALLDVRNTSGALPDNAVVRLSGTASLAIAADVSETVGGLYVDGVAQPRGLWNATRDAVHFSGSGTLVVMSGPDLVADGVWTSTSDGNWSVFGNWLTNTLAHGTDKTATFAQTTGVTVTVDGSRTIGNINVANAGYTLAGAVPLTLDVSSGTPTISVAGVVTAAVDVVIAGKDGLAKTGNGTLVLSNTNTVGGAVAVDGGTLRLAASGTLPVSGAVLWLDAASSASLTTTAAGRVTRWGDARNNGRYVSSGESTAPLYTADAAFTGPAQAVVNLEAGRWMAFDAEITTIRTVFWVMKGGNFLLGHTGAYQFHRDGDLGATADIWHPDYAAAAIQSGNTYTNGVAVNGTTTPLLGSYQLISLVTDGNAVAANALANDRNYGDRLGNQQIAEIVIYDRTLSDTERQSVEAYLTAKWFTPRAPVLPAATALSLSNGARVELSGVNQTVASLASADATTSVSLAGILTVDGETSTSFAGSISGPGALNKLGSGTLTLSGANSYIGQTDIQVGMLVASNSAALGAGGHYGETMSWIRDGATLALQGGVSINEHFHFWGVGVGGLGAVRSLSGNNSLTDSYCLRSDVVVGVDADTLTVASFYQQGGPFGLTKKSGGTLILSSFSYTGNTAVESGTLRLGAASLADGATVSLASGATLDLDFSGSDTVSTLYIGGVQQARGTWNAQRDPLHFNGSGNLLVTSGPAPASSDGTWIRLTDGTWNWNDNWQDYTVAMGTDRTATFAQSTSVSVTQDLDGFTIGHLAFTNGPTTITGKEVTLDVTGGLPTMLVAEGTSASVGVTLSGSDGLLKTGRGALTLSSANTYSGGVTVSNGTLKTAHAQALGLAGNRVSVEAGGTFDLNGLDLDAYTQPVRIAGDGSNPVLGALGNSGGTSGNLRNIRSVELTADAAIGGNNGRWDIGRIDFGGAPVTHVFGNGHALTKVGTGEVSILCAATELSGVTVNGGRFVPHQSTSFANAPVVINGGATVATWGGTTTGSHGGSGLTFANVFTLDGGRISTEAGFTDTYTGLIQLASGGGTFNTDGGGNIWIENKVSGPGNLTKTGANTLYASASNTYTGTTTLSGGALIVVGSGVIASSNALSIGGGSVFRLQDSASAIFSWLNVGDWGGSAGHVQQTGGLLTVTGADGEGVAVKLGHWPNETSTYTLSGGLLRIESSGSLALGTDGTGLFTQTGGTLEAPSIVVNHRNSTGNGSFLLRGGVARIGGGGLVSHGQPYAVELGAGTFEASASWSSLLDISLTATGAVDTTGGDILLSGMLSGAGGLAKRGSGTLTLSGASNYAGPTLVEGGVMQTTIAGALSTNTAVSLIGGTLDLSGASPIAVPARVASVSGAGGTLRLSASDRLLITGDMSGPMIFQISDPQNLDANQVYVLVTYGGTPPSTLSLSGLNGWIIRAVNHEVRLIKSKGTLFSVF